VFALANSSDLLALCPKTINHTISNGKGSAAETSWFLCPDRERYRRWKLLPGKMPSFSLTKPEMHYRLMVANLETVTSAHIHLAPPGASGSVVVWLYPSAPPPELVPGRFSGILATAIITADDPVDPLERQPPSALMEKMRAGNACVNVHTQQFRAGEIRGQSR
jgi:hypothetical protein